MEKFNGESLDNDGYPTDEFLDYIKNVNVKNKEDNLLYIFSLIQQAWYWGSDFCHRSKNISKAWYFYTGGWSGNESILSCIRHNISIQSMCDIVKIGAVAIFTWGEGKQVLFEKTQELINFFE